MFALVALVDIPSRSNDFFVSLCQVADASLSVVGLRSQQCSLLVAIVEVLVLLSLA